MQIDKIFFYGTKEDRKHHFKRAHERQECDRGRGEVYHTVIFAQKWIRFEALDFDPISQSTQPLTEIL